MRIASLNLLEGNILDLEQWKIPWQEFEVSLGLKNSLLQRNLNITSSIRAEDFLKNCGFDTSVNSNLKQFEQFLSEAIFFIRHVLFTKEERDFFQVPYELLNFEDATSLFILSSSRQPLKRYKRLWACAVLKVMYAISNLQFSERIHIIDHARNQIFKRIKKIIHQDLEKKHKIQFNTLSVDLDCVEWKESKTRNSIILKLLHKPDNIVDEVFDYLGVRLVVEKTNEIPLLLKLLIEADIIIPHQVVSMRSRNSILNIKQPQKILSFLEELLSSGTLNYDEFKGMCEKLPWEIQIGDEIHNRVNLFTNRHYKSMQFTVRHLVRTENPVFSVLNSLTNQLRRYTGTHYQQYLIEPIIPEYFANYFPIEIQILDKQSYEMAKFGPASHEHYKSNQLKAVRARVLSSLLSFDQEKIKSQEV